MRPRETYSIVDRRRFLTYLAALPGVGFALQVVWPAARFVSGPGEFEPDIVELLPEEVAALKGLPPNRALQFKWGPRPGLLVKSEDGKLRAFKAVCTHADCNVGYQPEARRFHCACHNGWYEADGTNVPGTPPPRPLEQFDVLVQEDGAQWTGVTIVRPGAAPPERLPDRPGGATP